MKTIEEFEKLVPCLDGLNWAKQHPSLYVAWNMCEKPEWLWWLLLKLDKCSKELSVKYSRACADRIKHLKTAAAYANAAAAYAYVYADAATAAAYAAAYAHAAAAAAYAPDAYAHAEDAANTAATAAAAYAYADAYADANADAAYAAAAYAAANTAATAAAATAAASERKWQAEFLRTLVSNPFEEET